MSRFLLLTFLGILSGFPVFADDGAAVRRAVEAIAPRLVRVDTIGGREKVGTEFANEGTSSAVLLDRDGFVLTSAFNFLHEPTSILLRFANGSKKIARKVATDRNRMLTLLKVEGLDAAFVSPGMDYRTKTSVQVGEPCVVVGVALSSDEPNIACGVISGKDRIWGKAIQTDAAVGPNNYGGLLIDADGKAIGLAVPISMMSTELFAGADTYDAGVGMAIPFEDAMKIVLPKLKEGKDLEAGTLGLGFKENRTFIGEALLDVVHSDSPAAKAGLREGDRIVAIDGKPIDSALESAMNLRPRYAGETIELIVLRGTEKRTVSLTTVPIPPKKTE